MLQCSIALYQINPVHKLLETAGISLTIYIEHLSVLIKIITSNMLTTKSVLFYLTIISFTTIVVV